MGNEIFEIKLKNISEKYAYFLTIVVSDAAFACESDDTTAFETSSEWSGDPWPGRTPSAYRKTI